MAVGLRALLLLLLRLLVQLDGQAVDLLLTQVRSSERNRQLLLQRMQIGWGRRRRSLGGSQVR